MTPELSEKLLRLASAAAFYMDQAKQCIEEMRKIRDAVATTDEADTEATGGEE